MEAWAARHGAAPCTAGRQTAGQPAAVMNQRQPPPVGRRAATRSRAGQARSGARRPPAPPPPPPPPPCCASGPAPGPRRPTPGSPCRPRPRRAAPPRRPGWRALHSLKTDAPCDDHGTSVLIFPRCHQAMPLILFTNSTGQITRKCGSDAQTANPPRRNRRTERGSHGRARRGRCSSRHRRSGRGGF